MVIVAKIEDVEFGKIRDLTANGKKTICLSAAHELKVLVQNHLRRWALSHHATARRLGARPTGHYETAARDISAHSTSKGAHVIIPAPGVTRYFRSLTIRPRSAKALTIPIHPASYGRRAGEMQHLGWKLFSRKGILFGDKGEGQEALYALKKSVTIPQDSTILPGENEMREAVLTGARSAMRK